MTRRPRAGRRSSARATAPAGRPRGAGVVVAGRVALLAVVVVLALTSAVRWRLSDMPLERDEGEYAYAGQLILQGVPPYQQAYNMKFPGTYYAYAGAMALFGETPRGIRLGLILVHAGTALLLFALGRRLLGDLGGAVAAVSFTLLALDRWNLGIFAHATHFVLLPAVAGLYLLSRAPDARRAAWLAAGGALLGVALLMKQHAAAFLLLGAILLTWDAGARRRGWRAGFAELAALGAGAVAPAALLVAVLLAQGVFDRFWFWTVTYARHYVSEVAAGAFLPNLRSGFSRAAQATWPLWLAGGVGLVTLWVGRWPGRVRLWLTGLAAASFLAVCPGFYFREHYFILLLPAVALLAAAACLSVARLLASRLPAAAAAGAAAALFLALAGAVALGQGEFFLTMSPRTVLRTCYGACPFPEAVEVGRYLREHAGAADRIAVLGSEPEIYFYARRRSATGYIYTYALMEPQPYAARMQGEMMAEIEAAHPRYLVFVQETSSWNLTPGSDRTILDWAWRYVSARYRLVGVAEILADESRYVWGERARDHRPVSPFVLLVYERREDAPGVVSGLPADTPPRPRER